jgi:hypothetical protein
MSLKQLIESYSKPKTTLKKVAQEVSVEGLLKDKAIVVKQLQDVRYRGKHLTVESHIELYKRYEKELLEQLEQINTEIYVSSVALRPEFEKSNKTPKLPKTLANCEDLGEVKEESKIKSGQVFDAWFKAFMSTHPHFIYKGYTQNKFSVRQFWFYDTSSNITIILTQQEVELGLNDKPKIGGYITECITKEMRIDEF